MQMPRAADDALDVCDEVPHRPKYDPVYFDHLETLGASAAFVKYALLGTDENGQSIKSDDKDCLEWGSPNLPLEYAWFDETGSPVIPIRRLRTLLDEGLTVTEEIPCIISSLAHPWAALGDYDSRFAEHPAQKALRASGGTIARTTKGFHLIEPLAGSHEERMALWVASMGRHLQQGADATWIALSLRRGYSALRVTTTTAKPDNIPRLFLSPAGERIDTRTGGFQAR